MDTSKEYIKMCEKAVEIQKLWSRRAGDLSSPRFSNNIVWIVGFHVGFGDIDDKDLIWLPRQDQLQEMVKGNYKYLTLLIVDVHSFMSDECVEDRLYLTMEQLWLAFVMKEKYGKTWNGTNWIK